VKAQYEKIVQEQQQEQDLLAGAVLEDSLIEDEAAKTSISVNEEMKRNKSESSATTSDSMERFERPSKFELRQFQQQKKQQQQQLTPISSSVIKSAEAEQNTATFEDFSKVRRLLLNINTDIYSTI
jgi:hypothetical protein